MKLQIRVLACVGILLLSSAAYSTTITVESDGTGDYASLGAAAAASSAGDTILVGPGTYLETLTTMTHPLVILSTHGSTVTTIDGGNVSQIFRWDYCNGVVVEGLTFTDCYQPANGSAMSFRYGSFGTVRDCVFDDNTYGAVGVSTGASAVIESCRFLSNTTPHSGAGVYVSGGTAEVTDCEFTGNFAYENGGAVSVSNYGKATFDRCRFDGNAAGYDGGAIRAVFATLQMIDCVATGNSAYVGSALLGHKTTGEVTGCTFDNNSSDIYDGACVVFQFGSCQLTRSIISNETSGGGLFLDLASGAHTCNLYHNISGQPVVGMSLSPDELVADPLYCDARGGDYTVSSLGPAAPANSACGQLIGALGVECDSEPPPPPPDADAPTITSIADVPNDQGRMVRIKWRRSAKDDVDSPTPVRGYGIYRYEGMITAQAVAALAAARENGVLAEGWDYLFTVPAHTDTTYQTVATTTCDSTVNDGLCQSAFFIRAETATPSVFWDSEPDSGYSVDNIPPESLPSLQLAAGPDGGTTLSWPESDAPDVNEYRVYRGRSAGFDISPEARVAAVKQTTWHDPTRGSFVYKVTVVDKAGNEGPAVASSSAPVSFSLGQNSPNPFNPSTNIPFVVPAGAGHVTLAIYDVAGRRIATLVEGEVAPGMRWAQWDGRDSQGRPAASGVYFYRLSATGFTETRKMVLLK